MAAYGYPRATMDIDIWVMPAPENADAVLRALRRFGAPLQNLSVMLIDGLMPIKPFLRFLLDITAMDS